MPRHFESFEDTLVTTVVPVLTIQAILRHGYMPLAICDCTLVPVPKDPTNSDNYRYIALASSLSKVREWIILTQFQSFLS